jgi:LPXTG-motif cell wall-anchored protein
VRRLALASTATLAALGLVALGAAPASAAELPTTDGLFSLTEEAFYTTIPTGASSYIADLPDENDGKYGADFDVTTGKAYYFSDTSPECSLYSLDPATGISTFVGFVGSDEMDECDALNVALDGTLRVADQDGTLLTVDKTTGATISSVTVTGMDEISFIEQASTGVFYAGSYDGEIFTLDVATGVVTFVSQPTDYIETASFDSADTLWFSGDGVECSQGLSSLSLADPVGSLAFQGEYAEGEDCISVYAMFITQPAPAPQLAATGSTSAVALAPFALLALLSGAGAVLMARRRRAA